MNKRLLVMVCGVKCWGGEVCMLRAGVSFCCGIAKRLGLHAHLDGRGLFASQTNFKCSRSALSDCEWKAIEGLRPVVFGPRTLLRTWGTSPF